MKPGLWPVLVIDDDADIRETMQAVLELSGYAVATAEDGRHGLDQLRAGLRPGVILLDLMMPGMNGFTFRRAQLADPELADIPVVVISGDSRTIERAASMGVDAMKKPVELERLLPLIERFCR